MSRHVEPLLTVLGALVASGCGGSFAGDYAGDVHVTYTPKSGVGGLADAASPVHVLVKKADALSLEIQGAPFSSCKLPIVGTRRDMMMVSIPKGACVFSVNGASAALPEGAAVAFIKDGALQVDMHPPADDIASANVTFTGKRSP